MCHQIDRKKSFTCIIILLFHIHLFYSITQVIALEFDIEEIPDIKWKLTFTLTFHPLLPVMHFGYDIPRLSR